MLPPPPPWVGLWTNVWVEGAAASAVLRTEAFKPGTNEPETSSRAIWGADADALSQTAVFRQELEKARAKPKTRTFRSLEGRVFEKVIEKAPEPRPQLPKEPVPQPAAPKPHLFGGFGLERGPAGRLGAAVDEPPQPGPRGGP
jgi:hypothetical protein